MVTAVTVTIPAKIISRKDNPNLAQAIAGFDETISFLFHPPEESARV